MSLTLSTFTEKDSIYTCVLVTSAWLWPKMLDRNKGGKICFGWNIQLSLPRRQSSGRSQTGSAPQSPWEHAYKLGTVLKTHTCGRQFIFQPSPAVQKTETVGLCACTSYCIHVELRFVWTTAYFLCCYLHMSLLYVNATGWSRRTWSWHVVTFWVICLLSEGGLKRWVKHNWTMI